MEHEIEVGGTEKASIRRAGIGRVGIEWAAHMGRGTEGKSLLPWVWVRVRVRGWDFRCTRGLHKQLQVQRMGVGEGEGGEG